ncbi:MAG: hypothetical protein JO079_11035 [Frankiaceae bacterium]|nr:hypothetical protein [Frankiaceae bacterium]MBV9369391.1 hypothetical protein [Frankiales bacterium]
MNVQTLPRRVISTYLNVARLPLTAAAKLNGQQDNEQWPPALTFEGIEASVETVLGSLLRDDALLETGRVRQAKVAQLRKAAQLEAIAESEREVAQREFTERRQEAEAKREAAEERARSREQEIEREAQQRKAQADQKAAKKAAAARQTKAAQEQVIERRERAVTAQALAEEAEALKTQQEALDAAETVAVIDDSIEGTKQARKTS